MEWLQLHLIWGKECNCQKGMGLYPIWGKYQTNMIVYKTAFKVEESDVRIYSGCMDMMFKALLYKHRMDANIIEVRKSIGIQDVRYEMLHWKGHMCLSEKLTILKDKDSRSMNKRIKCRHEGWQKRASEKLWPLITSCGSRDGWQNNLQSTYLCGARSIKTAV